MGHLYGRLSAILVTLIQSYGYYLYFHPCCGYQVKLYLSLVIHRRITIQPMANHGQKYSNIRMLVCCFTYKDRYSKAHQRWEHINLSSCWWRWSATVKTFRLASLTGVPCIRARTRTPSPLPRPNLSLPHTDPMAYEWILHGIYPLWWEYCTNCGSTCVVDSV